MAELKYHSAIARVVERIPKGRVASYGMVAALAGYPMTARFVGGALRLSHGLPWWRVIAKDGRLVIMQPDLRREQYDRLMGEGVVFGKDGRVDMAEHEWRPKLRVLKDR